MEIKKKLKYPHKLGKLYSCEIYCTHWPRIPTFRGSHLLIRYPPIFTWLRHQMEIFSALLVLCAGNSSVMMNSPHKDQWRGALVFSLICAWLNGWVSNCEAGDWRHHSAHYDVTVVALINNGPWIMNTLNSIINVNSIMGGQMWKCLLITYVKAIFLCFVNFSHSEVMTEHFLSFVFYMHLCV